MLAPSLVEILFKAIYYTILYGTRAVRSTILTREGGSRDRLVLLWHKPVLSRQIDALEPRLTRYGYDVKSIAEEFRAKPAEVRLFLQGQLDPTRWSA